MACMLFDQIKPEGVTLQDYERDIEEGQPAAPLLKAFTTRLQKPPSAILTPEVLQYSIGVHGACDCERSCPARHAHVAQTLPAGLG